MDGPEWTVDRHQATGRVLALRLRRSHNFPEKSLQFIDIRNSKRAPEGALCSVSIPVAEKPGEAPPQRFENWNERRALALPYFLRSTTRESRVRKPPFFSTERRSGSKLVSALEMP